MVKHAISRILKARFGVPACIFTPAIPCVISGSVLGKAGAGQSVRNFWKCLVEESLLIESPHFVQLVETISY